MCDVSVIIPVFNIEREVLIQCVDSVIKQESIVMEIFIIDDGSKAECKELCDSFKEKDCRIEVIHQANQGVSVARNEGIRRAKGKWIAFIDGDDWIEPNMLSKMSVYGNQNDADIVLCDCFINYNKKQIETHFFKEKELNFSDFNKDRFILQILCPRICGNKTNVVDAGVPWAKLYRSDFIREKNICFINALRRMQDNVFNLYSFEYARTIIYMHVPLYHYRKSLNSGLHKYNPNIGNIYNIYISEVLDYIQCFNKCDLFISALNYKIFFSIYVILNNDILNKDNPSRFVDKKKKLLLILDSPSYINAINELKIEYLNGVEKIFYYLIKYKLFFGMYLAIKIKKIIYKITGKGIEV